MKLIIKGVYIHIPFCESKCHYCDFTSFIYEKNERVEVINKYLDYIDKELWKYFVDGNFDISNIDTIFVGGGTPSILETSELAKFFNIIKKYICLDNIKEFTIECNPGTLTYEKLELMKLSGVNRLSIGLQSIQEQHLKFMGRIHNLEEFEASYYMARKIGFDNINVDLIFAFDGQSLEDWENTIDYVSDMNVEHISAYSLIIEEKTKFHKLLLKGEISYFDEDEYVDMYRVLVEKLESKGYIQYEISNYSKKDRECKHNIHYWNCEEYIGIGVSASGYINNLRYTNVGNLEEYFNKLDENMKPINFEEKLSKYDEFNERIMLGLRMNRGIKVEIIENSDFREKSRVISNLEKYVLSGHVEISKENCITLTQKGREISNSIIVDLMI